MTNTIKKVTLASLATLALAGAFTVAHTPTVLANTQIGNITVSNADDKDLTQKIKNSKESIKKKIQDKLAGRNKDVQNVSKRVSNTDESINTFFEHFDNNFVMSVEGLMDLGNEQFSLLGDGELEKHLVNKHSEYLKDLIDYYKCVKAYMEIDDVQVMNTEDFEVYMADSRDIQTNKLGERYKIVLAKLQGKYDYYEDKIKE